MPLSDYFLRACTGLGLLLLTGCGTQSPWQDYFQMVRQSLGGGALKVTLEQAGSIPYASLGYRIDNSPQAMLVLATDTNDDLLWTGRSRVVLVTRDGRVLRSVGLPQDRATTTFMQGATPPGAARSGAFRSSRIIDLPDIGAYSVTLNCTTASRGRQMVNILGTAMATVRVEETCQSENPRWSFTDVYWVSPDNGFVWRSQQHLHPKGGVLDIEILRPPE